MAKRKVNLTIDDAVFERAKRTANKRGESVSAVVERLLGEFARQSSDKEEHWLDAYYRKYLPPGHHEPSDEELEEIRAGLVEKYK